jgi:SAM-dependent methyltransferase
MNKRLWSSYDWQQRGEEWSKNWGGTANLWHGTLMPRIGPLLGDVRALEIAPGHGRITEYLKDCCTSLVLVDIAPNCIEHCKKRFAAESHIEYFVGDGRSLGFIADRSVDFVLSFDSLVHVDLDTMAAYLAEIERVLAPGGWAVLHHSNLAALPAETRRSGNSHLRAPDVSAALVAEIASGLATLECRTQEIISWDDSARLLDCISSFRRSTSPDKAAPSQFVNAEFYARAKELAEIAERYSAGSLPRARIRRFQNETQ